MMAAVCGCAGALDPHAAVVSGPCSAIDSRIRVIGPAVGTADRERLDRWCPGVSAAFVASAEAVVDPSDSLLVVTWNVHIGKAAIPSMLDFIRRATTSEQPFVLLLQETYSRRSVPGDVPKCLPDGGKTAGPMEAIEAVSRGLSVLYVPSMRNDGTVGGGASDRGNAILTNLPLRDPAAVELPYELQRRVAASAIVEWRTRDSIVIELPIVSAHLDVHGRRPFPIVNLLNAHGRSRQLEGLLRVLPDTGPALIGGDFNTAFGRFEPLRELLQKAYPDPVRPTASRTHASGFRLDHLRVRAAEGWFVCTGVLPGGTRGSDHFPVFGWIVVGTGPDRKTAGNGDLLCRR